MFTEADFNRVYVDPSGRLWRLKSYCEDPTATFVALDDPDVRRGGAVGSPIVSDLRPVDQGRLDALTLAMENLGLQVTRDRVFAVLAGPHVAPPPIVPAYDPLDLAALVRRFNPDRKNWLSGIRPRTYQMECGCIREANYVCDHGHSWS